MSRRYCSAIGALGAVVLAIVAGCASLFLSYQAEQRNAQQETEPNYAKPPSHQAKQACREAIRLTEYEKCLAEHAKAERVEKREHHDLQAQQDMARWAFAMFLASLTVGIFSLVIASVVAWYVRNTLRENRRTAMAGITSARAANRGVLHAEDTATRELRAYMVLKDLPARQEGDDVRVKIIWVNAGKTPASNCSSRINKLVWNHRITPDEADFHDRGDLANFNAGSIGPNQTTPSWEVVISKSIRDRIANKSWTCYVYGWIEYEDAFAPITPRRRTEVAAEVEFDAKTGWINFSRLDRFNGHDETCYRQPKPPHPAPVEPV